MKISSMTRVSEPSYNGVQFYTICQTRLKESLCGGFCSAKLGLNEMYVWFLLPIYLPYYF